MVAIAVTRDRAVVGTTSNIEDLLLTMKARTEGKPAHGVVTSSAVAGYTHGPSRRGRFLSAVARRNAARSVMEGNHQVQEALTEVARTGRAALDHLLPILYDELKVIARRHRRRERHDLTINTTDLVHEAYVKLVGLNRISWQNRSHILATAARAMRRVLVDHAVARRALKRGRHVQHVELEDDIRATARPIEQLLAVDTQLRRLQVVSPRLTQVVEC